MMPKPARWAVNPGMVAPSWRWAWRGLIGVVPFWPEGNTWPKHDIPLGRVEDTGQESTAMSVLADPENLGALPTYTLTRLGPSMSTPFDDTSQRGPYFSSGQPINQRFRTTNYWTLAVFSLYRAIDGLTVFMGSANGSVNDPFNCIYKGSGAPTDGVRAQIYVSSAFYNTGYVTLTPGEFNFTVAKYDGVEGWAANYVNGQQTSLASTVSIAGVADHTGTGQRFAFGCGALGTRQADADFLVAYIWDRALGDDEIGVLARDPFGPIRPAGTLIVSLVEPSGTLHSGAGVANSSLQMVGAGTLTLILLYATADGTINSVVNEVDTTVNLYASVDDSPSSPTDTDWINNTAGTGSVFLDLTNMPSDFGTMDTLKLTVRWRGQTYIGNKSIYAQIFQSNETTSMSDEVLVATATGDSSFANTTQVTFTGLDTSSGKAVWDGARIRLRWA